MVFPSLFLSSELLIKKPPGGAGFLPWGTGFVITTWNGICSLTQPATVIFFFEFDQMRFSDSILSSERIFCSAGAAQTLKVSAETVLALTSFAPVFSWPYILPCKKNN